MPLAADLHTMRATLDDLRERRIAPGELCHHWRAQGTLLAALPPRYEDVLQALLLRLESGSLFGEESCSFSLQDLHAALSDWLDKAEQKLAAPG